MGVTVETTTPGDGKTFPKAGDWVTLRYKGKFLHDGTVFYSTFAKNETFKTQIGVGQLIRGWDEGILKMSLGEEAKLTAYAKKGFGNVIPPDSDLLFEVWLDKIG